MAPVRRSSRRIRKELPEVWTQELSPKIQGEKQLRSRQGKEVEESVKMKHEDSIVVVKPPKSRRMEQEKREGSEENRRPTRRKKASRVEVEVMHNNVDVEKDKEPPKSPTLIRNIASPVSTRTDRQVLREQVPVEQQVEAPDPKGKIECERLKKQYALIPKTSSFTETFSGRLAWKKKHYDKPVTSTPVPQKTLRSDQERQVLEKDVKDCFGFNSDDEHPEDIMEYSTLISPIAKAKNGKQAVVGLREREDQKKAGGVAQREREEQKKPEFIIRQREQKKAEEVILRQREPEKPEIILRQREPKKAEEVILRQREPEKPEIILRQREPKKAEEVILRQLEQKKPEVILRRRDKAPTQVASFEKQKSKTESVTRSKQAKELASEVRRSRRDRAQLSNASTSKLAEASTLIIHQKTEDLSVTKVPPPPDKTPVYDLTASDDEEEHKANFSQLLHKYHPELDDEDKELCFNPHLVKATYGNKNKVVKLPARPATRGSNRKSIGRDSVSLKSKAITKKTKATLPTKTQSKKKKKNADKLDQKTEKWVQEMSKEFEEIEKFPLLIEKSP